MNTARDGKNNKFNSRLVMMKLGFDLIRTIPTTIEIVIKIKSVKATSICFVCLRADTKVLLNLFNDLKI